MIRYRSTIIPRLTGLDVLAKDRAANNGTNALTPISNFRRPLTNKRMATKTYIKDRAKVRSVFRSGRR